MRVLAVWLLALCSAPAAVAADGRDESVVDALVELEKGDTDWFSGRRGRGARAWRTALRHAVGDTPEARSIRIRARVRLLLAGSNWTPLARVPGMNRDALACPPRERACQLAFVDVYLLAPRPLGGDLRTAIRGAEALAADLPAASAARLDLADTMRGQPRVPARVHALDETELDGLGRAIVGGPLSDWSPGVSTFAAGLIVEPAMGIGMSVAARWPDAFRRRVRVGLTGGVATYGGYGALKVDVPTRWSVHVAARAHRGRWWDPDDDGWKPGSAGRVAVEIGPPLGERFWARLGPVARWDADLGDPGNPRSGHGVSAGVGWSSVRAVGAHTQGRRRQRRGLSVGLRGEAAVPGIAGYEAVVGSGQVVVLSPVGRGELAVRTLGRGALGPELPTTRTPFLGGPNLLRGAAFGDVRADAVALQSVELRHPIWQWFGLAAFADLGVGFSDTPQLVPGGGVGLRIQPTPALGETVRLDLGVSPLGVQVYAGWGEAF